MALAGPLGYGEIAMGFPGLGWFPRKPIRMGGIMGGVRAAVE